MLTSEEDNTQNTVTITITINMKCNREEQS